MAAPQSSYDELRAMATAVLHDLSEDRLHQIRSELEGGVLPEELKPYASKGPLTITAKGFLDLVEAELAQRGRPSLLGWLRRLLGPKR